MPIRAGNDVCDPTSEQYGTACIVMKYMNGRSTTRDNDSCASFGASSLRWAAAGAAEYTVSHAVTLFSPRSCTRCVGIFSHVFMRRYSASCPDRTTRKGMRHVQSGQQSSHAVLGLNLKLWNRDVNLAVPGAVWRVPDARIVHGAFDLLMRPSRGNAWRALTFRIILWHQSHKRHSRV